MANEKVIELVEDSQKENLAAIYIVNIKYYPEEPRYVIHRKGEESKKKRYEDELPDSCILDLPPNILSQRGKPTYYTTVETFAYNTISYNTGRQVSHCQIYLADIDD